MPNIVKNNVLRHMTECAQLYFTIHKKVGDKLENGYWYELLLKLVNVECRNKVIGVIIGANKTVSK
jgi:hypothetical protein